MFVCKGSSKKVNPVYIRTFQIKYIFPSFLFVSFKRSQPQLVFFRKPPIKKFLADLTLSKTIVFAK